MPYEREVRFTVQLGFEFVRNTKFLAPCFEISLDLLRQRSRGAGLVSTGSGKLCTVAVLTAAVRFSPFPT